MSKDNRTPEEIKAEQDYLARLDKDLPGMTQRQLQGHLSRVVRKNTFKEHGVVGHVAGLDIAEATVASIVLSNTKTKENPFAKLSHYIR
jgi:hypothetical protein